MAKKEKQVEAPATEATATAASPAKTETVVTMTDGRAVTFVGKRRILKESFEDEAGNVVVRMDFINGETRTFVCPESMLKKAAGHGLEQKFGDQTAGEDDIDDAVLAVDKLMEQVGRGEWNAPREAGGMSGTSILLQALLRLTKMTKEQAAAFLAPKSVAEKRALANDPKIRPTIKQIEDERAAAAASKGAKVEVGSMLGELGLA